jgi:hypothetical protein
MTDQPTKGPCIAVPFNDLIWVTKKENSHLNLQEVSNLRHILAAFHGPDREANAKLFLRAQHMDELVEAATDLLTHCGFDYDPSDIDETDKAKERRVRAILAKIQGEK